MSHRRSYAESPGLLTMVFDLLESIWPGVTLQAQGARRAGLDWGAASTPFVVFEGDRVISHVGVMEVPVFVAGEEKTIAAVHAVATRPEHRRKGHYRACMEDALAYIDGRYESVMLTTDGFVLYEPFGFRRVTEHLWRGPTPTVAPAAESGRRQLDMGSTSDRQLLLRLLRDRAPVSPRLGVVREIDGFAFYAASVALWHLPELGAVVWYAADEERIVIRDVVAPRMPSLEDVLAHLPERAPEVVVEFTADEFAPGLTSAPHNLDGEDWLMVRGPLACEGEPFMLPRTARF